MVVVAGKDQLIKPEHTKEISTVLESGTLLVFPNANHGSIVVSKRYVKQLSENITCILINENGWFNICL